MTAPERTELAPGLSISRIVTGLWQVADMERDGRRLDLDAAARAMADYADAGFDSFDMADHYGSAEDIAGRFLRLRPDGGRVFTKWCPTPGPMTPTVVRQGIGRSLDRIGVDTLDLLQLHWWSFAHLAYLDAASELAALRAAGRIRHLGVTNFDTDHLRLFVRHGIPIASNQVSLSLLDRRATREMSAFCLANGVRLLAYGTLAGGLLTQRWLDRPEPPLGELTDWSTMKYKRFVDAAGGWSALQTLLRALTRVAVRHRVSIANVATRWVLNQPAVAAVIVGARLGEREHRTDNLRVFGFTLDADDHAVIDAARAGLAEIPGDCGDEYRRPPFLTASGDLRHHLQSQPRYFEPTRQGNRMVVQSGSVWEAVAGFSRAVRVGDRVLVSGTTATGASGEMVCPGDAAGQAAYALDKVEASLIALGARREDVVRTRVYLRDIADWESVSRVHGHFFASVRPANTLVGTRVVGDYAVEIEAEAIVA